jgi:WD40 repeat protein
VSFLARDVDLLTCIKKSAAMRAFHALIVGSLTAGIALCSRADGANNPALSEIRVDRLQAPILSLDVAPESDLAVAALSNGRVRVWHIDTGEVVHEFGFTEPETQPRQKDEGEVEPIRVRFAPDEKTLAVSYLNRIYLYQVGIWSQARTLGVEGEDEMRPVAQPQLSERPLVKKGSDDLNTGTKKWAQRKTVGDGRTRITDFAFIPDGTAIVVSYCRMSCYDKPNGVRWMLSKGHEPVRLWDLRTGRIMWEHYSGPNRTTCRVVLSPDGKLLVEVVFRPGHWDLQLADPASGQESSLIVLSPFPDEPPDVVFAPDGPRFISMWNEPRKIWQMALFDTANGRVLAHFTDSAGATHAAISPNGLWLVTTTWRGTDFKLWDLAKRNPLMVVSPRRVGVRVRSLDDIRFASNGRSIVVSDRRDGLVFIYSMKD